jgi:hypothetical protein
MAEPIIKVIKEGAEPSEEEAPLTRGELLTLVWKDTEKRAASYPYKPSEKIYYDRMKILAAIYDTTRIEVTQEDSLVAGKRLFDARLDPAILNFADDLDAGGVVDNGNSAQEESLWRRTNLCATQLQTFYPLAQSPIQEGVYSPLVTVFKDTEENDCADLKKPWQAAFIAVPGLKFPKVNKDNMVCIEDMMAMRAKVELICQAAKTRGHDSLVLGALGCGVWRAPPRQMAQIMRSVLEMYKGVFKHIIIACYTRGSAGSNSNYTIFKEVFGTSTL